MQRVYEMRVYHRDIYSWTILFRMLTQRLRRVSNIPELEYNQLFFESDDEQTYAKQQFSSHSEGGS